MYGFGCASGGEFFRIKPVDNDNQDFHHGNRPSDDRMRVYTALSTGLWTLYFHLLTLFGIQNLGATNYSMHMLGLQKLVGMRGGLQAMTLNPLLYESLCV